MILYSVQLVSTGFDGLYRRYRIRIHEPTVNPVALFTDIEHLLIERLEDFIKEHYKLKFQLVCWIRFRKETDTNKKIEAPFISNQQTLLHIDDSPDKLILAIQKILNTIETFQEKGSGYVIDKILSVEIACSKLVVRLGASYLPLPKWLERKKAVINVKNNDHYCFAYSILASLFKAPKGCITRVASYEKYFWLLNFDKISFPTPLAQISIFEKNNPSIAINVWEISKDSNEHSLILIRSSQYAVVRKNIIHLLLLTDDSSGISHYCLIKSPSRICSSSISKHHGKRHFCDICNMSFATVNGFNKHICVGSARVKMPKPGYIHFEHFNRVLNVPLVIYADFECLLKPMNDIETDHCVKISEHIPCGFGMIAIEQCCENRPPNIHDHHIYRGKDCLKEFLRTVIDIANQYQYRVKLGKHTDWAMTKEDVENFNNSTACYLCNEPFSKSDPKVKDHCHICQTYRGALHHSCNLLLQTPKNVNVYFHNLRRYDAHFIMEEIAKHGLRENFEINCIPKGPEDYLMFSFLKSFKKTNGHLNYTINFIDTFNFLPTSLEKLVLNLKSNFGVDKFLISSTEFMNPNHLDLLTRKGVYPYEYMTNWERFTETELPLKENFYSKLRQEGISEVDYSHAKLIWDTFDIKNLGEYHDLYLKTDVLLLADVFENFRKVCMQHYGLDPAHYATLPSYGWDICLKLSKVKLELITDEKMYEMFEKGIRGGISVISHRYAKANNMYLPNWNPKLPTSYLMYFDVNNLYGWAMTQALPVDSFKWLSEEEIEDLNIEDVSDTGDIGYILEVDLDYPDNLHDIHNDYPLAPEKRAVKDFHLSPYCENLAIDRYTCPKTQKLIPNLEPKSKYIVHYQNLKFYLKHGLVLKKIHRVIKFNQRPWLKPYIELNTNLRKQARDDFEKDLFKLLNNSVFGKSMENVRKYQKIKLVTNKQQFLKATRKFTFNQCKLFGENLAAVVFDKDQTELNKPIYCGLSILDLSKKLMFEFHYEFMLSIYDHSHLKLCFTDTDSFCYLIFTEDIYCDMLKFKDKFDTADYPPSHFLQNNANKKVLGKMKDELNGVPIEKFVGLRSKMYALQFSNGGKEIKKLKGISKTIVQGQICFKDYEETLFQQQNIRHTMYTFRNTLHKMFTLEQEKIGLCCYDDKRYILDNGIDTLAYGHYNCET